MVGPLRLLVRGEGLLRQARVVHDQAEGVVRLLQLGQRQLEEGQQPEHLLAQPVGVVTVHCVRRESGATSGQSGRAAPRATGTQHTRAGAACTALGDGASGGGSARHG